MTGGTISFKITNQTGTYFRRHKGAQQGDPLSPIFFNFVADCLTTMVKQAQENKLFTGLAANLIPNAVVILQYADHTIVCLENDIGGLVT